MKRKRTIKYNKFTGGGAMEEETPRDDKVPPPPALTLNPFFQLKSKFQKKKKNESIFQKNKKKSYQPSIEYQNFALNE